MKYLALLPVLFSASALTAGPTYPSTGSQSSINAQDNDTAMPQPKPGQTVGDFLNMYFPDNPPDQEQGEETQPDLTKRNFTSNKGIAISKWTNNTGPVEEDYEIHVDLSPCDGGLNFSTEIGVFTTSRGITANVTLHDLLDNIWENHYSHGQLVNTRWAAQVCQVAELAMQEANALLQPRLLCNHSAPTDYSAAIYPYMDPALGISLRRLQQNAKAYWLATFGISLGGGLVFAGAAAGLQRWFNVNITKLNVIQTGLVVGGAAMTGGILNRCWAVGRLDGPANTLAGAASAGRQAAVAGGRTAVAGVQDAAANVPSPQQMLRAVAPQAHEAMIQNVHITWFRGLIRRIARQEARRVEVALAENPTGNPAENPIGNPAGNNAASNEQGNANANAAIAAGSASGSSASNTGNSGGNSGGNTVVNINSGNTGTSVAGNVAGNTGDTIINIGDDFESAGSGSSFDFQSVGSDPASCLSPDDAAQAAQEMQEMDWADWGVEPLDEGKFVPGQGIPPDCGV